MSLCVFNTVSRPPQRKHNGRSYTPDEIDFFAFYVIPEDLWYIVPLAALRRARYAVSLNPHRSDNKYFRYLEAWHLLKGFASCQGTGSAGSHREALGRLSADRS